MNQEGLSQFRRVQLKAVANISAPTAGLIALLALLYGPVLADLSRAWLNEPNASHGLLIPFIAGYLAWGKRQQVLAVARVWHWGLLLIGPALFLYPLGSYSSVEFLPQFSLLAALGALALYLWGAEGFRVIWFPYALLYFMIPLPDTLVEFVSFPMQLFAVRFATMVTGLMGMGVRQEGLDIHLKQYTFSVGVGCSGMNSVVALSALAALVAYLSYGPTWKRGALFAAGLPLALLANIGRIVCILLIASLWGAKAAEGFFHGFSGALVFMLAAMGMAATGHALGLRYSLKNTAGSKSGLLREQAATQKSSAPVRTTGESRIGWRAYSAPMVLVLLTQGFVLTTLRPTSPKAAFRPDFGLVPLRTARWQGRNLGSLDWLSQDKLRPDAYIRRVYVRGDGYPVEIAVLLGHEKETFHSPGFCLQGNGWSVVRKNRMALTVNSVGRLHLNVFEMQHGKQRRIALFWYASHNQTTPSWVVFQYRLLRNRILHRPTGGMLIRVLAPVGQREEQARRAAQELIQELYPSVSRAMALG